MRLEWDFHELFDFGARTKDAEGFNRYLGVATQDIAKKLHQMLITNTPVDFGNLQLGWETSENYSYMVEQKKDGYEVTLFNRTLYALWVNDGHKQRPGRFIPGRWEGNHFRYDPNADEGMVLRKPWVQGRFFVEKSILQLENSVGVDRIVNRQLQKWFGWCVNGK